MSTRNLIDAIASGHALDIESAFEDTMAEKVSVQIEAKRLQIAQTMFTTEEVDLDESNDTQEILESKSDLADRMYAATEPYNDDQESSDDVHADAMAKHGKKFADQLRAGASKMHFPRDNHTGGYDKLASRVARSASPTHVTKGGKLTKNSQKGLKASMKEEVDLDEEQLDEDLFTGGHSYHPTLSGKLDRLRSIHKKLTSSGYTTNSSKHLSTPKYEIDHMGHKEVTYKKPGQSDVTVSHGGKAAGGTEFHVIARKESIKKSNLPEESSLDEEQLDELSVKTLGSYVKKATSSNDARSISNLSSKAAHKLAISGDGGDDGEAEDKKSYTRSKGISRAVNKLTKEEVDEESVKWSIPNLPAHEVKRRVDHHANLAKSYAAAGLHASAKKSQQESGYWKKIHTLMQKQGVSEEVEEQLDENQKYDYGVCLTKGTTVGARQHTIINVKAKDSDEAEKLAREEHIKKFPHAQHKDFHVAKISNYGKSKEE